VTGGSDVEVIISLRSNRKIIINTERITILEAVIEHGSITKAAAIAGFSYKTAWDAVNAINNLLPRPAFTMRKGGPDGGGAKITENGILFMEGYRAIERETSEKMLALIRGGKR